MRPSAQEHQLAVLDTQDELEVVMEYISNGAFLRTIPCKDPFMYPREDYNPIGDRFFYNVTEFNPDTHRSEIKDGAEYPLDDLDASIALSAAKWVLARKWPLARIRNQKSGRAAAARVMMNTLDDLGVIEWTGPAWLREARQ